MRAGGADSTFGVRRVGGFGSILPVGTARGACARFETTYEWSVDRLPTGGWSVRNITHYAGWPEGGPTAWLGSDWDGTIGLEGPDGRWTGTIKGVLYPDGSSDSQIVLTGDGAYADLGAILYLRGSMSTLDEPAVGEEPFSGGELRGFIFTGPFVDWEDFE